MYESLNSKCKYGQTLFIQRTEMTPCRLPLVLQGILKSPHYSTLLIRSICLEIKEFRLWTPCHKSTSLQRVLLEMRCPTFWFVIYDILKIRRKRLTESINQ